MNKFYTTPTLLILLILSALLHGCATKEKTIYQNVFIPQKCRVILPIRPVEQGSAILNNAVLIEYALLLENTLKYCTGDIDEKATD